MNYFDDIQVTRTIFFLAKMNHYPMVELLLNFGADKNVKANHRSYGSNITPIVVATDDKVQNLLYTFQGEFEYLRKI